MSEWKELSLQNIKGVKIGHAQSESHATGCTVILPKKEPFADWISGTEIQSAVRHSF